jgi:hypothetical protein
MLPNHQIGEVVHTVGKHWREANKNCRNQDIAPKARVLCLKHESSSPELSGLFVLLTVEAFPEIL